MGDNWISRRMRTVAPILKLDGVVQSNAYPPTAYFTTVHIRLVHNTEIYVLANQTIRVVQQNTVNLEQIVRFKNSSLFKLCYIAYFIINCVIS